MLHNERRILADLEAREAVGESFWTESFEESLRVKIVHIIRELSTNSTTISVAARKAILFGEGIFHLIDPGFGESYDFEKYVLEANDDMIPTAIEAWAQAAANSRYPGAGKAFEQAMNHFLLRHRVSFELVSGTMISFSSRELHAEVVQPALRLLAGATDWEPVEASYQSALAELAKGDAADAITDAGTALQEAFTLLGCDGNSLGPLIKSALKKGILSAHDLPMLDAIEKVAKWVSADRSTNGDSHNAEPAEVEDAWLILHVVGALILRLSKSSPRK